VSWGRAEKYGQVEFCQMKLRENAVYCSIFNKNKKHEHFPDGQGRLLTERRGSAISPFIIYDRDEIRASYLDQRKVSRIHCLVCKNL
jgi:hypothetical protein